MLRTASKIALLLITADLYAFCGNQEIIFGGWSRHKSGDLEETNAGLGYTCKGVTVGAYKNSFSNRSEYVYKAIKYKQVYKFNFYVKYGLVTGYNDLPLPFAQPMIALENGRLALDLGVSKFLTLNLRYKLGKLYED